MTDSSLEQHSRNQKDFSHEFSLMGTNYYWF